MKREAFLLSALVGCGSPLDLSGRWTGELDCPLQQASYTMDVSGADGVWGAEVLRVVSWVDDGSLYDDGAPIELRLELIAQTSTTASPLQVLTLVYTGCEGYAVAVDGAPLDASCDDVSWEGAGDYLELDAGADTLALVGDVARSGCTGILTR